MYRAPKQQRRRRVRAGDSDADEDPIDGASEQQEGALHPLVCSACRKPASQTLCTGACTCVRLMSGALSNPAKPTGTCSPIGSLAQAAFWHSSCHHKPSPYPMYDKPLDGMQDSDEMQAALQDFSMAEERSYRLQVRLGKPGEAVKILEAVGRYISRGEVTVMHCRGPGSSAPGCSIF